MRVISGSARGIRLQAPKGTQTRPTADRVREALFSIIESRFDLDGAKILDICAGTGALGIEALSRGASSACFIEFDANAVTVIRNNLIKVKLSGQAEVLSLSALKSLKVLAGRDSQFDLIFFDPPYNSDLYNTVPEGICDFSLLSSDGLFIAESANRHILPEKIGRLLKIDRRSYGDTALDFYVLEGT